MRNTPPGPPVSSLQPALIDAAAQRITRLFESMRPELLRFALWLTRDRSLAEDVVQESLLRAWRSRAALKDPSCSRAWLLTIVRHEHARLYERKRLELVELNDATDRESGATGVQEHAEIHGLREAIMQLPLDYREPLILQVLGGFSVEEIAREMNLTTSAVLTRLFRARNKLRCIYGLMPAPDPVVQGEPL